MKVINFEKFNLVSSQDYNFLIDITPDFLNKINSQGITGFDFIIISDVNKASGLIPLKEYIMRSELDSMPIYADSQTIPILKEKFSNFNGFNFIPLKFDKEFKPKNDVLRIMATKCGDKVNYLVNNNAYFFSEVPTDENINFKGKDFMYFDNNDFQKVVDFINSTKPKNAILNNVYYDLEKETHFANLTNNQENYLAKDGLTFEVRTSFDEVLHDHNKIYAIKPILSEDVWTGRKTNIILSEYNTNYVNKLVYLAKNNFALALLKVKHPIKVYSGDLENFAHEHLLSQELIEKKFKNKEIVYSYDFEVVDSFEIPKKIDWYDEDSLQVNSITDYIIEADNNTVKNLIDDYNFLSLTKQDSSNIKEKLLEQRFSEDALKYHSYISSPYEKVSSGFDFKNIIEESEKGLRFSKEFLDSLKDTFSNGLDIKDFILKKNEEGNFDVVFDSFDVNDELVPSEFVEINSTTMTEFMPALTSSDSFVFLANGSFVFVEKKDNEVSIKNEDGNIVDVGEDLYYSLQDCMAKDYVAEGFLYKEFVSLFDLKSLNSQEISQPFHERFSLLKASLSPSGKVKVVNLIRLKKDEYLAEHFDILTNNAAEKVVVIQDTDDKYIIHNSSYNLAEEKEERGDAQNINFFKRWTPGMAYILGFLSTDGYLDTKSNRIEFGIHPQDRDILDWFARQVGGVKPKMLGTSIVLRFKSREMAKDLIKLGMGTLKPTRTTFRRVPEARKWDYIRGVFDADGNVGNDRLQVDNNAFGLLSWLYNNFKTVGGADVKYYKYPNLGKIVVLNTNGGAKKIFDKLYSTSGPKSKRKSSKGF